MKLFTTLTLKYIKNLVRSAKVGKYTLLKEPIKCLVTIAKTKKPTKRK